MEEFTDTIEFKNGVNLNKDDLVKLEELINRIFPRNEEESLQNINDAKYTIHYLLDGKKVSFSFKSIKQLGKKYENVELQELEIQKLVFSDLAVIESIGFRFSKSFAFGHIKSNNILELKSKAFLIDDFFENRQLKTGKINTWISEKLHLYTGLAFGFLAGTGIALSLYYLVIVAGLLLFLSGLISYPTIRNSLFPKFQISLKENIESERKIKIAPWIKKALFAILTSLIASFLFYFISKTILNP